MTSSSPPGSRRGGLRRVPAGAYINATAGFGEVVHALGLGLVTFGRVIVLVVGATLIWVPIGVWIGLNPKVSRLAQPVVQVLASFPANFLFPIATAVLVPPVSA